MINLIPNEEKKRMVRGFYFRLSVLLLFMLCLGIFIAILSILPAYFLSSSKRSIAEQKLAVQKAEAVTLSDQETGDVLKDINTKLSVIEIAAKNKFLISEEVINAILSKKVSTIKITKISYEDGGAKGRKISVEGTALSRDVLLAFRKALESNPSFKSVDLPISNFVKGSNIQFYLNITPA